MDYKSRNELISVILPIYNVESYLRKSINSVISQSYKNLEIILIDDGSTDRSGIICDRYAKNDSRIKVFHTKNKGLSGARNYGFDVSHGKYIFYLDSDDYISGTCIELLYKRILETKAGFVQSRMELFGKGWRKKENNVRLDLLSSSEYMRKVLLYEIGVTVTGKLFKREIIDKVKNPPGRIYEDNAVICKYAYMSRVICIENEAIYYYLINRQGSITNSISQKTINDRRWAKLSMIKQCLYFFPELKDETLCYYRSFIICLWGALVSYISLTDLFDGFIKKEKNNIIPDILAIRIYIFKNLKNYMKMSMKRKLQAILICFTPWFYASYIKIRRFHL